ncbi:MAG TPA: serine hydroxymethyltransferase [Steroidobacteraceae bacterium]|nr:serine hydroxymethyltransferase [Steroidobacteraceae bacterium]
MSHFSRLQSFDADLAALLNAEEDRQARGIELIPSENYTYPEVLATNASLLTNKYSEGYPGRRYYGGQQYTDQVELLAIARAKQVFRAEHVNVQPLSGSPMNQAVYFGLLEPGDTILAMDLSHGGHLTHGAPVSHMGRVFRFVRYKTHGDDGHIDFDEVRALAQREKPKMILCGHSSYPRELDYSAFKKIADEVGALTMADVSHLGGLIAGNVLANPLDVGFDVVTTTTHKSLRGPRGGLILCRQAHGARIDKSVFPGLQGGPHMNVVAGIAVTLKKALLPEFRTYAEQTLRNAKALAQELMKHGVKLVTGGTENHLMVLNTAASYDLDGRVAEERLDAVDITVNKQVIPDDPRPPMRPSGIRIGTPAATTRGMVEADMRAIAGFMVAAMVGSMPREELQRDVERLCATFPLPGHRAVP